MSAPTTREMCVAADHPIVGTDDGRWGPDTEDRCFCGHVSHLNDFGKDRRAAILGVPLGDAGRIRTRLVDLSTWLDDSYPANLDPEALHWRRIQKVASEAGEVLDAYASTIGENPRKRDQARKTLADVDYELLDAATAALGALVHMHGNDPGFDPVEALANHVEAVAARAGLL